MAKNLYMMHLCIDCLPDTYSFCLLNVLCSIFATFHFAVYLFFLCPQDLLQYYWHVSLIALHMVISTFRRLEFYRTVR